MSVLLDSLNGDGLLLFIIAIVIQITKGCEDGDIRLAGGPNQFEGRLEYCRSSTWGHVCSAPVVWDTEEARVTCRQLGFEYDVVGQAVVTLTSLDPYYGAQLGSAFINEVDCSGEEPTLNNCTKTELTNTQGCSASVGEFVYLICQDPACENDGTNSVRLAGGTSATEGRVEVCDSGGRRRQVCENGWDDQDATVVCRTLGFQNGSGAISVSGYDTFPVIRLASYNEIMCTGNEQNFGECMPGTNLIRSFPTQECSGYAGVNCLDSKLISTATPSLQPTPSTTAALIANTSTQSSDITSTDITSTHQLISTATPSLQPTPSTTAAALMVSISTQSSDITSTDITSAQSSDITTQQTTRSLTPTTSVVPMSSPVDNTLLIAVVGGVGGLVVCLLFLIVILFILILLKRSHNSNVSLDKTVNSTAGTALNNANGHNEIPPISMSTLVDSIKEEFQTPPPPTQRQKSSSDYDHVLLNPLYTNKRQRSSTLNSDRSSISNDPAYTDIKGLVRKHSPLDRVSANISDRCSVPSDTLSQRSHSPRLVQSSKTSDRDLGSQPYLDEEGYASLDSEAHLYDEMNTAHMYDDVSALSTSMKRILVPTDELLLSASPYETPSILPVVNTPSGNNVVKGSLLSPQHKFGVARSNPNLGAPGVQRGFLIPSEKMRNSNPNILSHEYRELEDTRIYDSPRNARTYEQPVSTNTIERCYEDPTAIRDVSVARGYESPVITMADETQPQ